MGDEEGIVVAGSLYREAPAIGLSSHFCAPLRVFLPCLSRLIDLPQVSRRKREEKHPRIERIFCFAVLVTNPVLVASVNGPRHAEFRARASDDGNKVNGNRENDSFTLIK